MLLLSGMVAMMLMGMAFVPSDDASMADEDDGFLPDDPDQPDAAAQGRAPTERPQHRSAA